MENKFISPSNKTKQSLYPRVRPHADAYTQTRTYTHGHAQTHTYTQTHTHTHTHTLLGNKTTSVTTPQQTREFL